MKYKHKFDQTILREYDIRGIVDENLSELDAFMLGYFFGLTVKKKIHLFKSPKIIVSRDGRISSENLLKNLIKGLLKSGSEIINIGSSNKNTNLEILKNIQKITKINNIYKIVKRRKGDVNSLTCSVLKAKKILDWTPLNSNINKIIKNEIFWVKYILKKGKIRKFKNYL